MSRPKYKELYSTYKEAFNELLRGLEYLDILVEDKTVKATNAFRTDRIIALQNGNKQYAFRMEMMTY